MSRVALVLVAGGSGERFGREGGKQLARVADKPVALWALEACAAVDQVSEIVLVCPAERVAEFSAAVVKASRLSIPIEIVASGPTRQESVAAGLAMLGDEADTVLIHDGARPLVRPQLVAELLAALQADPAADGAIVGHPSVDTLKVVDGTRVVETPERSLFWAVQTPQVFRRAPLVAAHRAARAEGFVGTDDASLVERRGGRVTTVLGGRDNIKVTVPEDLAYVEAVLALRAEQTGEDRGVEGA